jgi:hypothetical protein
MRILFITTGFLFITLNLSAIKIDSLYVGFNGGINNRSIFYADGYLGHTFAKWKMKPELRIGMVYQSFRTGFNKAEKLDFSSPGFFIDLNIHPIKFTYLGIRWEGVNFNWIDTGDRDMYKKLNGIEAPGLFSGTSFYGQGGFKIPVNSRFKIILSGRAGVHSYKMSSGSTTNDLIIENHTDFVYNITGGLEINLYK